MIVVFILIGEPYTGKKGHHLLIQFNVFQVKSKFSDLKKKTTTIMTAYFICKEVFFSKLIQEIPGPATL